MAFIRLVGGVKFEAFLDIGNSAAISGLLDAEKFINNQPDIVGYASEFTSRLVFPDSSHENYGGRMSGWILPPETASYQFFLRSDEAIVLFGTTPPPAQYIPRFGGFKVCAEAGRVLHVVRPHTR